MTNSLETEANVPIGASRSLTNIFFLVDTSGSMQDGAKIDAVNTAMHESLPMIREFASGQVECKIQCSIIEFNDSVRWLAKAVDAEDLQWIDLNASGGTSLGAAYSELCKKLSRYNGGFMAQHKNNRPIIILLTDGQPTDDADSALAKLKKNEWFINAFTVAIELPGDVDRRRLIDFATSEMIIPVTLEGLKSKLQNIIVATVTHSMDTEEGLKNAIKADSSAIDTHSKKESQKTNDSNSLNMDDFDFE